MNVTVVVPAYNAGAFLRPAVASLLAEPPKGLEVVVVDDGSTDGSIESIADLPVRLVRQANSGVASARNAGVRAARGRYLTFLDADDLTSPGALRLRADFLDANPGESVVGGFPSTLIDPAGALIADVFPRMSKKFELPFRLNEGYYRSNGFFPVSFSLYLYRREVFDRIGGYDETLRYAEDCDFHFRLLRTTEIPILGIRTFERRIHSRNLTIRRPGAKRLEFREDLLAAIRGVNRRYDFDPQEIVPWEAEYL
jgi:glycosyltransferase involved in cell wall biosynthesis